jgi:nucleoside-diphosphate-sugar epimerase
MGEISPQAVEWRDRVTPIAADIRSARLGLSGHLADRLSGTIDAFVHAAAETRFRIPLKQLWDTNVDGTRRVLDFAASCRRLSRIVVLSTVCTSGTRTGRIPESFISTPPEFLNDYERTKWESERLALDSGLPLGIARVSIVVGSRTSGAVHRAGALHHLFKWFGRGLIPVIPGTESTRVDLISTETVARFVSQTMARPFPKGAIWHVAAGDNAARLSDIVELSFRESRRGAPIENIHRPGAPFIVDRDAFEQFRPADASPRQRVVRRAMDSINSFLPGLLYPRVYDTTGAEQFYGAALACPDWRQTLLRMIRSSGLVEPRSSGFAPAMSRVVDTCAD